MAAGPVPQYPIESVDNALKVLLLLGERPSLRLTDVGEYLGVASSTAHRLLAMLQYRGFVQQDPKSKVYLAGTALTGVAFAILQRFDFRAAVHPFLERLNADLGETVHLGTLIGASVHFVDAIESPRAVRVVSRLGLAMPASSTSTGKALLSGLADHEVDALYPTERLDGLHAQEHHQPHRAAPPAGDRSQARVRHELGGERGRGVLGGGRAAHTERPAAGVERRRAVLAHDARRRKANRRGIARDRRRREPGRPRCLTPPVH